MQNITYSFKKPTNIEAVRTLYKLTFKETPRPTEDIQRFRLLFDQASIVVSAYANEQIVGICRALSDFSYVTYISDLCVDPSFQHQHIGSTLLQHVKEKSGSHCKLVLLSNVEAHTFYPKLGFSKHDRAWVHEQK